MSMSDKQADPKLILWAEWVAAWLQILESVVGWGDEIPAIKLNYFKTD